MSEQLQHEALVTQMLILNWQNHIFTHRQVLFYMTSVAQYHFNATWKLTAFFKFMW